MLTSNALCLLCRLRDEHAVASRGLTLEASTLRADNARLAGEAGQAQAALAALQGKLEAAQREAHQVGGLRMCVWVDGWVVERGHCVGFWVCV